MHWQAFWNAIARLFLSSPHYSSVKQVQIEEIYGKHLKSVSFSQKIRPKVYLRYLNTGGMPDITSIISVYLWSQTLSL